MNDHFYVLCDETTKKTNFPQYLLEKQYRNAGLSVNGFQQVFDKKGSILDVVKDSDIIITSPIKRAMQTCLLTYNDYLIDKSVYVMPLVTETSDSVENKGIWLPHIINNPDTICYRNSDKLDYKYFWFSNYNAKWWCSSFRNNVDYRIKEFKKFLKQPEFTNKQVTIYTHWGFINCLTGLDIKNYDYVKLVYNQDEL